MANGSSPPGPFAGSSCEVPYIAHWEEFINKCFLSQFRNASPSVAFEALSSAFRHRLCSVTSWAGAGLRCLLLLIALGKEVGRNCDGVAVGLQKQPPRLQPALCTIERHHLGSGPPLHTSSLSSWVPGAAPSCPGLKVPAGIPGTGRAGVRRVLLLHLLAPGKCVAVLVGKLGAPVTQVRQDEHRLAAPSSPKTCRALGICPGLSSGFTAQ